MKRILLLLLLGLAVARIAYCQAFPTAQITFKVVDDEGTAVENELVCHAAVGTGINQRVVILQTVGHVVGVENCHLRGARQTGAAHERDVDPTDRQNARAAVRGGGNANIECRLLIVESRLLTVVVVRQSTFNVPRSTTNIRFWQKRRELLRYTNRSHPRPAAAVGDAEGFMQVEVADIGADVAGTT